LQKGKARRRRGFWRCQGFYQGKKTKMAGTTWGMAGTRARGENDADFPNLGLADSAARAKLGADSLPRCVKRPMVGRKGE